MKTAMQELIDKVEHAISYNVEGGLVEKYTWEELSNDMYVLLEKEKEQIMTANIEGTEHWYRERALFGLDARTYSKKRAEQYYNEQYGQGSPDTSPNTQNK